MLIWVTLSLVTMDHPVSYDYGSLSLPWLWITLCYLTNDHPVSSNAETNAGVVVVVLVVVLVVGVEVVVCNVPT